MENLIVDDAKIEYEVRGSGEPVLLIHVGLVADGMARPLFVQPELAARYQLIHYHRRGYMGSTPGTEAPSIAREAKDAAVLLGHLKVKSAHVVGHSISGLIALQLALDAPDLVHTLVLMEPILRMVPSGNEQMEHAIFPMMNAYRSGDKRAAIKIFGDAIFGPNWEPVIEQTVPGGVEQAVGDIDAFMRELPTIQAWQFGPEQAAAIRQPVLSVLGVRSTQVMREGRVLLHSWFPQTEDFDAQSTHLLQMQDPVGVAHALAEFFSRHPIM
jgi:pimeloyl-ACP methyl ester carboxylesterase